MGRKLRKIVQDIEVLVTEMNAFGFKYQQQPPVSSQLRRTDHASTDPEEIKKIIIESRANDQKKIVDILVGQANNADLTVVPIVGMGGQGKTTLAQLVYNDPKIQKYFDLLLWVCVSDCFDVDSLAKSIVEAAPKKKSDRKEADASMKKKTPLDILQNVVSGQRYLLVLNDVWARQVQIWTQLKARLEYGGMGSVVLTTTRDERVAGIMHTIEAYNLKALDDKFIKKIIETTTFSRFKKAEKRPTELVDMVDEIVKRCVGSPLAATELGSVLCTKTSKEEWEAISIRSSICTEETGILSILKLSYNDLPSHMKQCFAFCAVFPKDYEIDVDKLIQLWIAHGFIQEKQVCLETIGKQIFSELASRSFFQDVKQVQATSIEIRFTKAYYSRTTCKIHDLMHDVALSIMEKECAHVTEEPSQGEWLPNTARHLFLSCKEPGRKLNVSLQKSSPAIQTLLCDGLLQCLLQHSSKYSSLQALQLNVYIRSFPLKPKHLHHLRYLDLSRSFIKELPEDMSILYNLQTLNLSGCSALLELPRQMKYMTALRHLYTHGCVQLKSMPRDIRNLTSLCTLTCFVAGSGSNCSNVGELCPLNLGGLLELYYLAKVTEEDAEAANLVNKQDLRELTLGWTRGQYHYKETSCADDARVLAKLKPHDGLHAISILSYGGTTFPTWMTMLQNLKELRLENLDCLERWGEIDNDEMHSENIIIFPRLEKLLIIGCTKLTALPGRPSFPELQNACIRYCPDLRITAESPKLSVLNVYGSEVKLFRWLSRHMTSLTNLELESTAYRATPEAQYGLREVLDVKEKLNDDDIPLTVLVLKSLKSSITELCACFVHLQDLSINFCDALIHWPEREFQGLVSLRKLQISFCNNLIGYAPDSAEPSTSSETSQLLPSLESLVIKACHRLVEVFNVPPSLRRMKIEHCEMVESPFGRRLQQGQSALSIHQQSSSMPEVSSSSPGAVPEHLEELTLIMCYGLTGVLHLHPSLKELVIRRCGGLTSLESRSGELPSLKHLSLSECLTLSSLPDEPVSYLLLEYLGISYCPDLKTLPASLQKLLGKIDREYVDAHHYGNKPILLKPKTWKYAIRRD
ncbi:hypothetical protein VPH35_126411 [Triticum aestivum]